MKPRSAFTGLLLATAAHAASAAPGVVVVVERLYHDYAWEAVLSQPSDKLVGLMQAPPATLEKYFQPALARLIVEDRECAARTHEICRLDFDPIWGGQDPGASDLTIAATSDPAIVRVRFTYPGDQHKIELKFALTQTAAGWRIGNISAADWDLLKILTRQP